MKSRQVHRNFHQSKEESSWVSKLASAAKDSSCAFVHLMCLDSVSLMSIQVLSSAAAMMVLGWLLDLKLTCLSDVAVFL